MYTKPGKITQLIALTSATLLAACVLPAQTGETQVPDGSTTKSATGKSAPAASFKAIFPAWYEPTIPFRIIGQVYYVGSRGLAMYFIPTAAGHILIDGGLPENAGMILDSISELGFDPADIRILLNTHAHFDHSGGLARLKDVSGAQLLAAEGDRSALEGGFYLGSEDNPALGAPAVNVDRTISDGEVISLGDVSLTAHLTPGHTRGCTSWKINTREANHSLEVLIFCSASVAMNRLVEPAQYPGIVRDYRTTFNKTRSWHPDVFLANHTEFFGLEEKRQRQVQGEPLAFVDKQAFARFIAAAEADFEVRLQQQIEAQQDRTK